jgi:pimeloyl-ACP methyl ester carboxylesterase
MRFALKSDQKRMIAIVVGVLAIFLGILGEARNLEHLSLNDAARRKAPGQFVRLADGLTHYELTGADSARTVVLLTGMTVPYYLWDPTRDALVAAGYRVLRYDYYGRGWSDRPDVAYDLDSYDRQLWSLLDSLAIRGAVDLAGNSMGGVVAASFANQHPERVRSLILIDPAFAVTNRMPFPLGVPGVAEYGVTILAPSLPASQRGDFLHSERFPTWASRYREQMEYHGFRRAFLRTARGDAMRSPPDAFGAVDARIPILIIWGRQDHTVPFERSTAVRQVFPRAEFQAIDSAGHLPQYERADAVGPLLMRFLSSH